MPRRDPHLVLGVERDAAPIAVKAAWRRLARENHPDLTAGDPIAARAATRRMAEINAAYEELRSHPATRAGRGAAASPGGGQSAAAAGSGPRGAPRPGGQPWPRPGRPVTGRLDTSDTFRPRNQTTTGQHHRPAHPLGRPPVRASVVDREPPRASDPTGPLRRSRIRRSRPPEPPPLEDALALRIAFGKFNGHTLGEIAAFEPSYIDWVAGTITRDPDLVASARVIRDDLDARGISRVRRADRIQDQPGKSV